MTEHAKNLRHKAMKEIDRELVDVRGLRKSLLGLARDIKRTSADTAEDAMDYVNDRVDDVKSAGVRRLRRVESRIKSKPGQSVAIAFAAGLLSSFLFSRKDKED